MYGAAEGIPLDAVARFRQLIVGGAGDDAGGLVGDGVVVAEGAQRARRKDIGLDPVNAVGRHRRGAELLGGAAYGAVIDVGDD